MEGIGRTTYRRNALAFVGEATLFGIGIVFAGTTTILPDFINTLTGSAVFVGLIVSFTEGAWRLPQVFLANWLAGKRRKKPYLTRAGFIARPVYLVYAAVLAAGAWRRPVLALAVFFLLHTAMYAALSIDSLVWWDIFAKAIPPRRRGRVLGTSTVLRGAIAVAAGAWIGVLLGESGPGFPANYIALFAAAGSCFVLSLASWGFIVEPVESIATRRRPWPEYFAAIARILREDRAFRRLIAVRLLAGFDGLALGFYVVFALQALGLPRGMLGVFTAVQTVGGILSGILFGWISERIGSHRVIQCATAFSLSAPVVAALFAAFPADAAARIAYPWVFLALGAFLNAHFIGFSNFAVELAPPGERSAYVGLFNAASGLVVLWPAIGGWLLERTSYSVLFTLTAGFLLVAHLASWCLPPVRRAAVRDEPGKAPLL